MADADGELTVAQRLGRLLDRGLLPAGGPAEAAERLIERLERPARVVLLGLPGSGKSAILNLLAGTVVVPETLRLPTIIVQHGHEPRMLCTLSDGRIEIIPGDNLEKSLALSPALITLELDLPALKVISLLEVAAGPLESDQRRAALWAGKRADILIWCTTSYLPKEQLVWEGMPDAFKDNGFLLLTKVDLLGGREAASGMHHRVEQRAGSEFRQVLSISAKEARAATSPGGQVDRDRFRESGAGVVISTIKTRVQSARRADTDTAELILARQAIPGDESLRRSVDIAPPEPAVVKSPVTLVQPTEVKRTPLVVVAEPTPSPEPETRRAVEETASPEAESITAATAQPQTPVEPEPIMAPPQEVMAEPEPQLETVEETITKPDTNEKVLAAEPPADPATATDELAESDAPTEVVSDPQAVEADEAELASDLNPALNDSPEPAIGFLTGAGGKRLSDRIKQIRPSGTTSEAPLVPLRATWKSRNDATPSSPAEVPVEPVKSPRPRPVDPANVGRPSFRVSAAKETASIKGELRQPETGVEESAEDRLKALRHTDEMPTPADTDEEAPVETPPEDTVDHSSTTKDLASASGDPVKIRETETEDPDFARLSALRSPRPETQVHTQDDEPELEEDPTPEVPAKTVAEDPTLARFSALRQPVAVSPAPVGSDLPGSDAEPRTSTAPESKDLTAVRLSGLRESRPSVSGRIRPDRPPAPAEALEKATTDDASIQTSVPAEPEASAETTPDEAPKVGRAPTDPPSTEEGASDRRPLSARLSYAAGQTPGAQASSVVLGPRMPRSGVPGSPRVTVLRERRVEVQPVEHRDRVRIAPTTEQANPAVIGEPATVSAAEAGLLDLAIGMIVSRSAELSALIDPNEKLPVDLILEHGCETTERVIEVTSKGNSPAMRRINGSLSELQDVIMLMQLEKGHAPADDTLTLLLQLRRELETLRPI